MGSSKIVVGRPVGSSTMPELAGVKLAGKISHHHTGPHFPPDLAAVIKDEIRTGGMVSILLILSKQFLPQCAQSAIYGPGRGY
jgi:hypothetical protein